MFFLPVFAFLPAVILRACRGAKATQQPANHRHQPLQGLLVRRDD